MSETPFPGETETRTPITDNVVEETNRALESVAGNPGAAARLLNVTTRRVYNIINHNPAMRAKWSKSLDVGPVSGTDILDRPTPPPELPVANQTAIALIGQERKLTRSLARLGFSSKEQSAISEFESFAGQHFQESLKILHGGMLKNAMSLMLLAEQIRSENLFDEALRDEDREKWWNIYFRVLEEIRGMNDQANKAALTQAMIALKEREAREGKLGKPGFSAQHIAVQVNTVAQPSAPTQVRNVTPAPQETNGPA